MHEAKQFLLLARKNLADGAKEGAVAYASAVLISDEVSVNVNVDAVPSGQRESCKQAMAAALTAWESALDNTIHFRIEDDSVKADVRLRYQPDVKLLLDPVAGLTTWKRTVHSENGKVTGISPKTEVLVRTRDLHNHPMTFETMRQATEHEFGHVLGLEDSDRMGDIMGQLDLDRPVLGPRDYEANAVKSLREEAKQVKAQAESKLLQPASFTQLR
jgi:hypothetical protein